MRVRDDIDVRSSRLVLAVSGKRMGAAKKEPASYWFDRRHVERFNVRVQSLQTTEGEVLPLLRDLDPKMVEIYG